MTADINIKVAIETILQKMYFDEFEIIDGLSRHSQGINFYEWLFRKGIITYEENARVQEEVKLLDND